MKVVKLPPLVLALALQVMPFSRAFVVLTPAGGSSFAIVSTWIAGALALLGSVDAVSGASTTITSPKTATATNGVPFSYRITTGPEVANTFAATPLPPALIVSTTSGRITGTPSVDGVFVIRLTASDSGRLDRTVTADLTLTILPPGGGGVPTAPSITTQPASKTVTNGGSTSFTVVASGTAPLTYGWRFNGNPVAGATNSALNLSNVSSNQAGNYSVVVTNSAGSVTSSVATLTVLVRPAITSQPVSQSVTAGANVSFSVAASGTAPLSFQWKRNNVNVTGPSATLALTAVTTNQAGSYTCVVTNSAGVVTSAVATLTVMVPPTITTQPASQSVIAGANVSMSVVASGTAPLSYQWQFNGVDVPGATSATLALTGVTTNQAGSYACLISNSAGAVTSSAATLTVRVPPAITSQPVSQTVTVGANVDFSVMAGGTAPLSYQWRRNGVNVSGATSATLNLTAVTTNQAGSYTCVVTNSAGSATSSAASLTVNLAPVAPTITTQPVSQSVTAGANVSMSVVASGTAPLSYQWQFNGTDVPGTTSATLSLTGVTTNQAGSYTCVVTNSLGSATSSAATLTVNPAPVPPTIAAQPQSQTVNVGANVSLNVTAGGTAPLSYQWRRNGVNVAGATSALLSLTGVTTNQAGSYTCVVTNNAGAVTSAVATLTVLVPPSITTQPASQTVLAGANVSLSVVASGTAPLSYQWQLNGLDVAGATSTTLALTGVTTNQAGSYTCVVGNAAGSVTSSAATLTVRVPPTITTQPVSQSVTVGADVSFSVEVNGTSPLSFQWRRNGVNVSGATSALLSLTAVTTNQAGSYTCVVTNSVGTATSSAATLTVSLAPVAPTITTQPATQSVMAGANVSFNVVASGTAPLSYQWQFNGAEVPGATSATLALTAVTTNQAGSYTCVVANSVGSVTSAAAALTVRVPPVITSQPISQTVTVGANVDLSVTASGTAPLSHQWRRNGVNVAGATSATLSLTAVTTNQAGSYTCVVTNSAGSATSSAANLTVNLAPVAPTITTQPVSQSVAAGANVSFNVVAGGTAPLGYQWQLNGVDVAGATSATLALTGVTTNQAGSYLCVVTNSLGSATSSAATLTVSPAPVPPTIVTQPQSQTVTAGANVSLSVEVNGTTPMSYQWRRNGVNVSGATSATLSLTAVTTNQAGSYTCVITNSAGTATSSVATLTVLVLPTIVTQPASQSVLAGANVSFSVVASGTAPLNYQWQLNGVDVAGATSSTLALTSVTTNQAGSYTCVVANSVGSATSSAATLTVNPAPIAPTITNQPQSQTVTVGANVSLSVEVNGTAPLGYQWRRNGVNVSGATSSMLSLTGVTTNQAGSYNCVVTNSAGSVTSSAATLTVLVPVTITTQPVSQTVTAGANVSMSVVASGTAPLSYQWQLNGVDVAGATSATLALTGVTTNQAGSYTCVVSNAAGAVTSAAATLTVREIVPNYAPSISPLLDVFTPTSTPTEAIPFTIGDVETDASNLTLRAVGTNAVLVPANAIVFGGAGSNRTIKITPYPGRMGLTAITVLVSDGTATNQSTFQLDVHTPGTTPLTLLTNGNGSVTPNLAGQYLVPGRAYTITAAGGQGHMFAGWSGDTNSGSRMLTFVMRSNLTLQANFARLNLTAVGNGTITPDIRKTANLIPGQSYYVTASGAPGQMFVGWSGSTNTTSPAIRVSMNPALELRANFVPLNLTVNGLGTLAPDLRKTAGLLPGRTYTMTAYSGVGQEFAGWSGSLHSPSPSLTVVLTSNLNLRANFIPSPYIPIAGTYRGLFYEDKEVRPHASGFFSVAVTTRGTYSGWLQTTFTRHSFAGKLGLDCRGTNVIPRPYFSPLKLTVNFGTGSEIDLVSGQVGDTNWTASLIGDRVVFNSVTNPATYAGNYTLVLPGQKETNSLPAGDGFGTLRLTTSGLTTFAGTMGDGARVIQSSAVSKHGRWPLHAVLTYGTTRGALIGWMTFADRPEDDLNGALIWAKPANWLDRYYPLGFNTECPAIGSVYRTPVGPQTNYVLNLAQAEVNFSGGNLPADFANSILFGPYSRVSNLSGNPLTLSFSTSLGTFTGSVTDPSSLKPFSFRGAVLQKQNAGFGFLTGTNKTSHVGITQ